MIGLGKPREVGVSVVASAGVLLAAAVIASFLQAARAARSDMMQALRSE